MEGEKKEGVMDIAEFRKWMIGKPVVKVITILYKSKSSDMNNDMLGEIQDMIVTGIE
jgi:hypothetical protein